MTVLVVLLLYDAVTSIPVGSKVSPSTYDVLSGAFVIAIPDNVGVVLPPPPPPPGEGLTGFPRHPIW